MRDHAAPGGTKVKIKKLGEDESSENSDSPHSDYVENKRFFCSSDALHKSFDYNEETVERFRNRNHSKNGGTESDYFGAVGKNVHKSGSKGKKASAGNYQAAGAILQSLLSSQEAKSLMRQLGEKHG